jgi:hypothetical protein
LARLDQRSRPVRLAPWAPVGILSAGGLAGGSIGGLPRPGAQRPERLGGFHARGGGGVVQSGRLPAASPPSTSSTPARGSRRRAWPRSAKAAMAVLTALSPLGAGIRPGRPAGGGEMERSNALAINIPKPSIRKPVGPCFGSVFQPKGAAPGAVLGLETLRPMCQNNHVDERNRAGAAQAAPDPSPRGPMAPASWPAGARQGAG